MQNQRHELLEYSFLDNKALFDIKDVAIYYVRKVLSCMDKPELSPAVLQSLYSSIAKLKSVGIRSVEQAADGSIIVNFVFLSNPVREERVKL